MCHCGSVLTADFTKDPSTGKPVSPNRKSAKDQAISRDSVSQSREQQMPLKRTSSRVRGDGR